ncbi:putative Insect cuticle protein domain-containing protein 3 [Homarus americanus]|uniref:Putative Insect cuticle protein domain-containing protein 3 n=1 Tax=Homarus americanus TaxID=6706 RepID=A0A8J5MWX4_HOMAM|nr:putative Insect cuticle protein domain-containing protein 3 [Homarus americanus]
MLGVLVLCSGVLSGEILRYTEPQHSRSENGSPGLNVTGRWSWVDNLGERHHIWYVADKRGFRAFGDVVPNLPEASTASLAIGVPVVDGVTTLSGQETLAKGVPAFPPEQRTLERGVPTLEAGHKVPVKGTGSNPERGAAPLKPHATSSGSGHPSPLLLTLESSDHINSEKNHNRQILREPNGQPDTPKHDERKENTVGITAASRATTPKVAPPGPAAPLFAPQHSDTHFATGQSKNLVPQESVSQHGEEDDLLQEPALASIPENNFVSGVFNTLTSLLGDTTQQSQAPTKPQETNDVLIGIVDSSQAQPIKGTDFVLIDRLRIPNVPKLRVGSPPLVPQPVGVKGQSAPIVMGLHTSGRPPLNQRVPQTARSLAPLGIHLLNLVPFQGPRKINDSKGPVPRPVRIVGKPNLENFFRPVQLARTTPSPFRLPSPIRDYDYQYFDYDYYDYGDYEVSSMGGPGSPFHKTKSKSDSDISEENSTEGETPESEETDD